jgi:hypothetical protein
VTVEAAGVQYAYRHIEQVDWNGIQSADGQFVLVTVNADGTGSVPSPTAFRLVADGESYEPVVLARNPLDLEVSIDRNPRQADTGARELLVFDVPAHLDTAPSLRLDRDGDSWEWGLDTEKATSPPPAWEWTASAPETVVADETFAITIAGENVGDGPGTFRGAVNFSYPMYRPKAFDIALDAGESGEATVSASADGAEPGTDLSYGVRTPAGESTVAVTVEAESATGENETSAHTLAGSGPGRDG